MNFSVQKPSRDLILNILLNYEKIQLNELALKRSYKILLTPSYVKISENPTHGAKQR